MLYFRHPWKLLQVLIAASSVGLAWFPLPASAILLQGPTGTAVVGNQAYSGVGVRFHVNTDIEVTDLGIFDSDPVGFTAGTILWASLFLQSDGSLLEAVSFDSTSPGTNEPLTQYNFKPITPLTLLAGIDYVLAGYGWTATDPEHNGNVGLPDETFTGSGLVSFVNAPFGAQPGTDAHTVMPTVVADPARNYFMAANLIFEPAQQTVPEPATLALLGLGLAGLGFSRRKQ